MTLKIQGKKAWQLSAQVLFHVERRHFIRAKFLLILIDAKFLHKKYAKSQYFKEKGQYSKAITMALACVEENSDENLVVLYLSNLHSLPWNPAVLSTSEFQKFLNPRKSTVKYNFPPLHAELISISQSAVVKLTEDRFKNGLHLDTLSNTWTNVNQEYLQIKNANEVPLDPIVGISGMKQASVGEVLRYVDFVESALPGHWDWNATLKTQRLIKLTDLGSLMDVTLITRYFQKKNNLQNIRILEIGGGYGRLAEALLSNLSANITKYVMVDAIPVSLVSASEYLGLIYSDDNRLSIVESWKFSPENFESFDLVINVESFQEMEQAYVDYWLATIESLVIPGSTIYHSNSFDYVNKTKYSNPRNWQTEYSQNTPRSWTTNHPSTVMTVG